MKPSYNSNSFNVQLSNLKTSLSFWDDLISRSNKLTASVSIALQCMSGFLEAFQKISDIAETNNAGLRPFGIALRRYCLRQRCVESRLRSFNSQITECLVSPLSDRLDEWRRTANQMDRDCVKELRKAKSELQRAVLEAEKCKKRLRRKERGGVTAAFEKDDFEAPNVQINFAQHDLACKQRALEHLEQRCLEAVAVEERRRFAELSTCLNPLLDAHLSVLAEMGPLEEALKEIQAAHSAVITPESSASAGAEDAFRLRSTPLVKAGSASATVSQNPGSIASTNGNLLLDPTIATGSAALSFAVAQAPSTLSITSTSTNGGEGGGLFGHTDSVATLHSPDADGVSRVHPPPVMPPQPASAGLGCAGSPGAAESLLNGGGGSSVMGGDVLSLFDHNQSISGAPTVHSASSSSSLGLLPINCDAVSALGSMTDSASPNALGEMNTDGGPLQAAMLNNNAEDEDEEEEDGGTTEGCLTEDDENDETIEAGLQSEKSSSAAAAVATSAAATMEKSVLYPNQALPPPVYTNISKLQAAAQRGVGGAPKDSASANPEDSRRSETPPLVGPTHSLYDNQPEGRKFSQPTATISKGGMASLLRSLSISGRPGLVPPGPLAPPPPGQSGLGDCEGAGEGLSLSPPHTSCMTPVIADQAVPHSSPPPPSAPNSPSAAYAEARSRIDAIFSNVENISLRRGLRGYRAESPPPTIESLASVEGMDPGGGIGGGAGNTSTFRRKRPQRQGQSQQRTAGINLMRGSMFQLNTSSTSVATGAATTMDMDMRYGYDSKQTPMTPGPGRRAPLRTQLSTSNELGHVIRPPRRSSSVCRELPGLCQQQPFHPQSQPQQNFFPQAGHLSQVEQQQQLNSNSHYAAPRGVQQHPQRVYADPRSFQQQQPQQQNGTPITAVNAATTAAAAQLAVEAVAARRHQQYASSSGLRNPVAQRTISPTQNGLTQSRLPQRQSVASSNNTGVSARTKAPRAFYGQQQQLLQTGIPSMTGTSLYGYSGHQYAHHQQHHNQQSSSCPLQHQQQQQLQHQMHQDYPPPPAAFDDVESTSFIESPPPPPPPPPPPSQ